MNAGRGRLRAAPLAFRRYAPPMRFAGNAAVGFGVGGIILGSFAGPAGKPALSLVDASPVVIAGSGYTAGAKFFVTYHSGATQARRHVVATLTGRYRVVLKGVTFKRCNGLQLVAPGASVRVASCANGARPSVTAEPGGLVSGSAFVPDERVAVIARMGDLVARGSARAGSGGTFSDRLSLPRAACTDIYVRATGALGSSASFTVAMPACRKP
jgi:hypothetical protein